MEKKTVVKLWLGIKETKYAAATRSDKEWQKKKKKKKKKKRKEKENKSAETTGAGLGETFFNVRFTK